MLFKILRKIGIYVILSRDIYGSLSMIFIVAIWLKVLAIKSLKGLYAIGYQVRF